MANTRRDEAHAREYAVDREIGRAHGSYNQLFADPEIERAYITVPNSEHATVTTPALCASKHVLCEKPLATSREEGAAPLSDYYIESKGPAPR